MQGRRHSYVTYALGVKWQTFPYVWSSITKRPLGANNYSSNNDRKNNGNDFHSTEDRRVTVRAVGIPRAGTYRIGLSEDVPSLRMAENHPVTSAVFYHRRTEQENKSSNHSHTEDFDYVFSMYSLNFPPTNTKLQALIRMWNSLMKYASNVHINKSQTSLQKRDNE